VRILVTGSEGNIGRHLVAWLRARGHEVHRTDILPLWSSDYTQADILSPADLVPLFMQWRPEVVYHLAAMVSRVTCEQAPHLAINTNVSGTHNVARLCIEFGAKLVFTSTSEVYGNTGTLQAETTTPEPNNRYGLSKWLAEQVLRYDVLNSGLRAIILRPFMFYHEDETRGSHRSAMINFADALSQKLQVHVHRNSKRGWLHLNDGVRALERAAHISTFATINIGNPNIVETEALAKLMCQLLQLNPEDYICLEELPARMTLNKTPDLGQQKALLDFEPEIALEEGVRRVLRRFGVMC